jgi:hypothetical protein
MNNTKQHTQGPWVANGNQIHAANKHETFVADVFDQNGDTKGNARLIAAAPELLDAINEAEKHLSGWFMVEDADLVGQALDTLRAAIKKAKGE